MPATRNETSLSILIYHQHGHILFTTIFFFILQNTTTKYNRQIQLIINKDVLS